MAKLIRKWLMPRGRGVMEVLLSTLLGEDEELLSQLDMDAVHRRAEQTQRRLPLPLFLAYKAILFDFQYGLWPWAPKLRPFTWLPKARRERYVQRWAMGRFHLRRHAFLLLRYVALSSALTDPGLLVHVGYGPEMACRVEGTETCGPGTAP